MSNTVTTATKAAPWAANPTPAAGVKLPVPTDRPESRRSPLSPPAVANVPTTIPTQSTFKRTGEDSAKPAVLGSATVIHSIGQTFNKAAEGTVKAVRGAKGAVTAAQVGAATGTVSGTLSAFRTAFVTGLATNAIVAGALSLASNAHDAINGRTSFNQFAWLTIADTVGYTVVGAIATAAAAAVSPLILGLIPAIPFAGFLIPVAIAVAVGVGGSWLYGKFGHDPLKAAIK